MSTRVPENAIAVSDKMPPSRLHDARNYVLGWASAPEVAIHNLPIVVWWADDKWWAGLPGCYLDLERHESTITHWMPIEGAFALPATHDNEKSS